jgi:hypothetical protein
MKFSSNEDIEAPIGDVFAMLSEFEIYERSAIRRGIEVQRVGEHETVAVGMAWDAQFSMRGKKKDIKLSLTECDVPNSMRFETESQELGGVLTLDLLALSPGRTRLSVTLTLAPKTLPARLLVQSLKLAKGKLTKRFKWKVAEYAKSMENRHNRMA